MNKSKIITLLVTVLLVCNSPISISQDNRKIDSLMTVLTHTRGIERAKLLYEISREWLDTNNELGYKYATEGYEVSKSTGDTLTIIRAARLKAQALRRLGKIDSALVLLDEVLAIAKRHDYSSEVRTILNSLGVAYLRLARYDKALLVFFELSNRQDVNEDRFWRRTVLNNIGLVYENLEDFDTALKYFYKSIESNVDKADEQESYWVYINISLCLAYKYELEEARSLVNKVLRNCGTNCSDEVLESAFSNLGIISFLEQNYEEAEQSFLRSYQYNKRIKNDDLALENLAHLVKINTQYGRLDKAEEYLKCINSLISKGVRFNQLIIHAYLEVISMYERYGDYRKLAYYQKKYITLKDSIFDQRLTTNLMKIEAEYLEKENKAKIESQSKILALNEEVIQRQKYLNLFIAIVALLLIALTIVLFRSNRQKQKLNTLLDKKVRERTIEIESNCDALQRAYEERDLLLQKTSMEINTSLATVKGLCCTGLKDVDDPLAIQYLDRMNMAVDNFSNILSRLQLKRNNVAAG